MANIFPIDFEEKLTMAQDDYILFSDSEDGNKIKKAQYKNLKGEKGNPGADGNGIASITSTKIGKTTTVTITETDGNVDTFQIQDGADGVGGDGDVKGPDSSTNGHMAVFDGATGKIIRDGGSIPTGFEPGAGTAGQILRKTNSGYEWDDESAGGVTSVNGQTGDVTINVPTKVSDLTNDAGYTTNTGTITSVKMNGSTVSSSGEADLGTVITSHQSIKTVNSNSLVGTGDVTINAVPSGGTEGQVLTKGSSGYSWEDASSGSGDVVVSTDTGNELSTGVGLWLGTETDFSSISTPDANTLYIQYKSDGGGGGWTPGASVIAYFPFDQDKDNQIVGGPTLYGNTNSVTTYQGANCLYFDGVETPYLDIGFTTAAVTSGMFRIYGRPANGNILGERSTSGGDCERCLSIGRLGGQGLEYMRYQNATGHIDSGYTLADNQWNCIGFTEDSSGAKLFLNGNLTPVGTSSRTRVFANLTNNVGICGINNNGTHTGMTPFYMSKFVLLNASITIDDFLDFYNKTKADYGIS